LRDLCDGSRHHHVEPGFPQCQLSQLDHCRLLARARLERHLSAPLYRDIAKPIDSPGDPSPDTPRFIVTLNRPSVKKLHNVVDIVIRIALESPELLHECFRVLQLRLHVFENLPALS